MRAFGGFMIAGMAGALVYMAGHCGVQPACQEAAPIGFYEAAPIGAVIGAMLPARTRWKEVYTRH
jgi:hypothetical protein